MEYEYILNVNNYKPGECPKLRGFTRRIEHKHVRTEAINS